MDWFKWLSRTALESSLVYEYGLVFSHNQLEQQDIIYFNHDFLLTMGISIAKHRLEILKLARKDRAKLQQPRLIAAKLMLAIKRTKKSIAKHVRAWIHREESSALVVVPRSGNHGGSRWRGFMMKRNKKEERMLVNNGCGYVSPMMLLPGPPPPFIASLPSPMMVCDAEKERKIEGDGDGIGGGYWSAAMEEIRWDTMFQDLKPT